MHEGRYGVSHVINMEVLHVDRIHWNAEHERVVGIAATPRLWTEIAALTGAKGNSTALVGTPQQVSESLLDHYDAGISTFLIRGFDPLEDALEYGRELIPLVRAEVLRRDARQPELRAVAG